MKFESAEEVLHALIHAYYDARDTEAVLACVCDDVEWVGTESRDHASGKTALRRLLDADMAGYPASFPVELFPPRVQTIGENAKVFTVAGRQVIAPGVVDGFTVRGTVLCTLTEQGWLACSVHVSVPNAEPEKYRLEQEIDDRRRMERLLMASIPGGTALYRLKKDGRVTTDFVSPGLARMCGYDSADDYLAHVKNDALCNVGSGDVARILAESRRALEEGGSISLRYHIRDKNGREFLQRMDANVMDSRVGPDDIAVLYAVHGLVSEEAKAIISEQERLRALVDTVPAGIGIYELRDGELSQSYMNDAFYRLIGTTREKREMYYGTNVLTSVHPDDIPLIQAELKKLANGSQQQEISYRLRVEGEGWFWVHLIATVAERRGDDLKIYAAFSDYNAVVAAQRDLENSRSVLRLALQTAKAFTWIFDYRIARITDSGTLGEAFGLPKVLDDLPQVILDLGFVSPESEGDFRDLYERVKEEKIISADIQSTVPGEEGAEWYRIVYTPIFDAQGRYTSSVGVAINITEQHYREQKYEEQLRLSRMASQGALSRVSLNLTRNLITSFESNGTILSKSLPYQTADELLASVENAITDPNELRKFDPIANCATMIRAFRSGQNRFEITYRTNDSITWQRVVYRMMENPYTGDIEAISAIHDATEAMRDELVVSKLMAIDYSSIALIDPKTHKAVPIKQKHWDNNLEKLRALQKEDIDGFVGLERFYAQYALPGTAEQVTHNNSIEVVVEKLADAPYYENTYTLLQNGKKIHFRAVYSYLENGDGALLCAVQDITEIYEQEEKQRLALADALKQANAANIAKTAFLSRVSHDMRTPINGILGLTGLMKDVITDERITRDLSQLELSAKYLLRLINDTLDVGRIEQGRLELHPSVCEGRGVFNNVQSLILPSIKAKNIRLEVDIERLSFRSLYVDEGRFQQVAMNILGNAVKFTPEGGTIRMMGETLAIDNGIVTDHYVVEDTGCGMSAEFLPHLFEPFSQENAATTNSNQGTGLGMSITKQIVELMNGEISVTSEQGKGTRFDIVMQMPLATKEQLEVRESSHGHHAGVYNLEGKRLLLCEDHPLNATIATRLLKKQGMLVERAENGEQAVQKFSDSPNGYYDAILMDIRMPIMDGIDATRAIRALPRLEAQKIPIIAMTANALDDDVKRTCEAGMNAHLSKPIDPERLYATLERLTSPHDGFARQRILVVDDVELNRKMVRSALEPTYRVFEAESGEQALQLLKEYRGMDAMVTDIQMPGMDGVELIRRVRADEAYRHMVILVNTQYEVEGQEEMLLALGVNDFIYKPTRPEIVKTRIKNALHRIG